jgi:WD repeat-containing protein 61
MTVEKLATCHGHQDCIYTVAGFVGSRLFYTAGADGMVVQWNLDAPDQGEVVAKVGNTIYALCPVGDEQLIVGQNFEGIHQIDLRSRQQVRSLKLTDAAIFDIQLLDGLLFVACGDGSVTVVDMEAWHIITRFRPSEQSARTIAINAAWKEFAVGYSDNSIRVFSLENRSEKYVLKAHANSVFTLAYSPDAAMLYSGGRDAHMRSWAVADNYAMRDELIPHMYTVNHIAFRTDGKFFATCSKDKSIRIWDTQSMKPLTTINKTNNAGHGTSVNKLRWMDDTTLVSVSDDRTVSIWKLNFQA